MNVAAEVGILQPRADGREAHGTGQIGKWSDGRASGENSARSWEGKLNGYVTIHVTTTLPELLFCLYLFEVNGGLDRIRICDLLRVKQAL